MPLRELQITKWLPFGMALEDVIVMLASLAVLAAFLAMWQVLRPKNAFERRLEQIIAGKERLRQDLLATRRGRTRLAPVGMMRQAVTRLNLLRSKHAAEARGALARAGFRSQDAMVAYLFAQVSLPFLFGIAMLADTHLLHLMPLRPNLGSCLPRRRCYSVSTRQRFICGMPPASAPSRFRRRCPTVST